MTITADAVLLDAATHDMGTRAGAPTSLQDLRDGPYSLHHVLPYRYPLFVGFLVMAYREAFVSAGRRPNWPAAGDTDLLAGKVADLLKVVSRFGAAQQDLATKFAWMGPNLFQGPSGNLRIDDPGSEREANKPCSMDQRLWDQLLALGTGVDALATLDSKNGSYSATTTRPIAVRDLDKLLTAMLPLAERGHGNALGFVSSDWLCLTSNDPRYAMTLTNQITGTFKQQFKISIQSKPSSVVLRKSGDAGQPETRVLWRLRLPSENVPPDAVPAPRLQP